MKLYQIKEWKVDALRYWTNVVTGTPNDFYTKTSSGSPVYANTNSMLQTVSFANIFYRKTREIKSGKVCRWPLYIPLWFSFGSCLQQPCLVFCGPYISICGPASSSDFRPLLGSLTPPVCPPPPFNPFLGFPSLVLIIFIIFLSMQSFFQFLEFSLLVLLSITSQRICIFIKV